MNLITKIDITYYLLLQEDVMQKFSSIVKAVIQATQKSIDLLVCCVVFFVETKIMAKKSFYNFSSSQLFEIFLLQC